MTDQAVPGMPTGFKPFQVPGPFFEQNGPVYYRKNADGSYSYGLQIEARHTNPDGIAHGGLLCAFADQFLGRSVVAATKRQCATIKLATEYLAPARPGDWIEGTAAVIRTTRTLAFMQGEVWHEERLLLTADGVWKLFKAYPVD